MDTLFGHALESSCDYTLPHGIAVSYGIDLANLVAVHLGLIGMNTRNYIRKGLSLFLTVLIALISILIVTLRH